jgi:hypothetical protein
MNRPLLSLVHLLPDVSVNRSASSCWTPNGDIHAIYGYANWGLRLRYAVIRSFPRDATAEQIASDPRIRDDCSNTVLVRSETGAYVPVSTDGAVYIFEEDALHTFRVTLTENGDDLPLITEQSTIASIIADYRRFER